MRFLFFITFLSAILFSELAPHISISVDSSAFDVEMPSEESSEKEGGEETNEDHIEEDKLFNESQEITFENCLEVALLPCKHLILLHQSLREIHIPPPDLV